MTMRVNVKSKLENYLEPLPCVSLSEKYHWWFSIILYPLCVNEFSDVSELHGIESLDITSIVLEIMPKLYDYIVASELAENPYTAPPAVTTTNWSPHLSEETLGYTITDSGGGIYILKDSIES